MRCAVIDVGSNSVLLSIGDEKGEPIFELDRVTALGEGLNDSKKLKASAIRRTAVAVCELKSIAEQYGAQKIIAVGTMALRIATNARDFIKAVKDLCGINIRVISGNEEAKLSFEAATTSLNLKGKFIVSDIGGRSTEIACGEDGELYYSKSLDIGALKLLEGSNLDFKNPVRNRELEKMVEETIHLFQTNIPKLDVECVRKITPHRLPHASRGGGEGNGYQNFPYLSKGNQSNFRTDSLDVSDVIIIGGTATNLAAIKLGLTEYDPNKVHGLRLTLSDIYRIMEMLASMSVEERKSIPGLQPERAEIIIPGTIIILALLKSLGKNSAIVSDRGLRHAILKSCYSSNPIR